MTMFNIMNMLMGQNAGLQLPFASQQQPTSSGGNTPEAEDDLAAPKSAAALVTMVKSFGEEKLTAVSPSVASRLSRLGELTDAQAEAVAMVECTQCSERLPSILALSSHYDMVHSSSLPDSAIQSFADQICEMIPDVAAATQTNGHHLSPAASRSSRDGEPPEKRPRSEANVADPAKPDLAQMAMLSMMGSFPFLPPNPLGGFVPGMGEFFNPLNGPTDAATLNFTSEACSDENYRRSAENTAYFDINNSPSECQIKEMSIKAGLPEKVIKHWFRNTLFKVCRKFHGSANAQSALIQFREIYCGPV
ncbi:hypothetical protein COOONC_05773 [Cooperia oncophora]